MFTATEFHTSHFESHWQQRNAYKKTKLTRKTNSAWQHNVLKRPVKTSYPYPNRITIAVYESKETWIQTLQIIVLIQCCDIMHTFQKKNCIIQHWISHCRGAFVNVLWIPGDHMAVVLGSPMWPHKTILGSVVIFIVPYFPLWM